MITENVKMGNGVKIWHPELVNLYGCTIGDNCHIGSFVEICEGVIIGNNCSIQSFCFIPPNITIGNDVFLGPRVIFTNDKYPPSSKENWSQYKTIVEDNVSIGAGSIILPGLVIGAGSKIGAGSVVTKDVKSFTLVYGVPAKRR